MAEQLLKPKVVAQKLGISISTLYRIRGKLIAKGVKTVTIRGDPKYVESSIDQLIAKCGRGKTAGVIVNCRL